jgi:SprT protein
MEKQSPLAQFVPENALPYCLELRKSYIFDLHIKRPRKTRLGDFTVRPHRLPQITVNANLNPYNFLITYLHEIAHCAVFQQYKKRVAPHGREWKQLFSQLLQPVLTEDIFPPDVLIHLIAYARNPKAATGSDQALFLSLKNHDADQGSTNKKPLIHLKEGTSFVFQNREFIKGTLRRTRVLCTDPTSKRRYTIPAHALVEEC